MFLSQPILRFTTNPPWRPQTSQAHAVFVHSTSVACRSLHGYLFLLSYTVCGDLSIDADPTTLFFVSHL